MASNDGGVTQFAVYEDKDEFYGIAEVKLPDIEYMTETIKGAGIAGSYINPYPGLTEAMKVTFNFRTPTRHYIKLGEPRNHQLECRAQHQHRDNTPGVFKTEAVKYVFVGAPTKFSPGKLAPAASADASAEYAVTYMAMFLDGIKVVEVDVFNYIFEVNGVDYLASLRDALGK